MTSITLLQNNSLDNSQSFQGDEIVEAASLNRLKLVLNQMSTKHARSTAPHFEPLKLSHI